MNDSLTPADYEEVLADHRRLVRQLDVALNGEAGAAPQASLVDIVAQVKGFGWKLVKAEPADVHMAYICTGCGKQVNDLVREDLQSRSGRIQPCCPDRKFVPWDDPRAQRMHNIDAAHLQLDAVEKTWAALFAAEDVGQTRTYFSDVFENIRNARRTR